MKIVSGTLIPRNYTQFRGVDFSNRKDEVNIYRSPDALNMWKNYKSSNGKCIETRPDVEDVVQDGIHFIDPIYGLFFYGNIKYVHVGINLYQYHKLNDEEWHSDGIIYSQMANHESKAFVFNKILYIYDGTNFLHVEGNYVRTVNATLDYRYAHVPTTRISMSPSGGGVKYEDVNLVSPYRKNSFCADGTSSTYHLDTQEIDTNYVPRVYVNDEQLPLEDYNTNWTNGTVYIFNPPPAPYTDGQDNVVILFKKTVEGDSAKILNCTIMEVFDNRVFASGNPYYPNYVWHCSLNDASYWSDLDVYQDGEADSAVKALVAGNNALWVLKSRASSNTSIFYHNPTIDPEYGKIYPSVHSSISTGCETTGINFNDTICFYSNNGLEAITSDVTTEQVLTHKSSLIDSRLLNETNYKNMKLIEWEGYLLTIIDNKIYLADSRQYSEVNGRYEYEWYYFEFDKYFGNIKKERIITNVQVKDDVLYLCIKEPTSASLSSYQYRVFTLTNDDVDRIVESYWTTIEDEFNYPQYQKITNKKGCVVDAEGKGLTIYARTDNKEFDLIKKFDDTKKGYVVPRIKKKKWKSIQLKFYSKKSFRLYSFTLESYVGSYIKR